MKHSAVPLSAAIIFLVLSGCATGPAKSSSGAIKSSSPVAVAEGPGGSSAATLKESASAAALPPGEYAVLVETEPEGGTVVVNGIPVGKAPQRVVLPGTSRGFFRDQVSLKVRFIGLDSTHASQTVEELLTTLDKIPASVKFTPAGASRQAR